MSNYTWLYPVIDWKLLERLAPKMCLLVPVGMPIDHSLLWMAFIIQWPHRYGGYLCIEKFSMVLLSWQVNVRNTLVNCSSWLRTHQFMSNSIDSIHPAHWALSEDSHNWDGIEQEMMASQLYQEASLLVRTEDYITSKSKEEVWSTWVFQLPTLFESWWVESKE